MKKCMGCMEEFDEMQTVCPHCGYIEGTKPVEVYHMEPGSILAKRYIVGKTLGYGGFGVTYIGYDAELERKVAIKEYLPGEFSTRVPGQTQVTVYDGDRKEQFDAGIEKFLDEAKRLAKFQNTEGIVHIYDSFLYNDTAYIIMEYIDGETLKSKIERDGKMPVESALKIVLPVASALKEVHEAGIIHRDISPDNIMIDKDGKVSLIDFGASRFATTTHSKSLSVLIKQGYAPVEQYQSRGEQGPWTDVYALASTLYFTLTGIVPDDAMERMEKDELKSLSKLGVKTDKNIETAIMNGMNLKIEERTPSMDRFEEELLSQTTVTRLLVRKEKKDVGQIPAWVKITTGCVASLLFVFLLLMATGIIRFKDGVFNPVIVALGKTMVPNVVNTTVEMAEAKSSNKKLSIQIIGKEYSDEIEEGIILSQNITSGEVVDEETVLEVIISAGKEAVFMPSLVGLTKEEAIALLEEYEIAYTLEEVENISLPGTIATQSVAADEKISKGDVVTLQVSLGILNLDETSVVIMPNISGLSYEEAQKVLKEKGLYLSKEAEVYDLKVAKDKIISQSVPEGSSLHQGDSVKVIVSLGREQVRVPDVQYETEETAKQMIVNAGLMAKVTYEYSTVVKKGIVIRQSIEKDSKADVGTTIEIVVSLGAETVKETEWSGWGATLPSGVNSSNYDIESRNIYYYKTKTTLPATTDSTLTSQGWTLEKTLDEYGEYGNWSDVTENPPSTSDTDTIDVSDPITQYNYQYYKKETGEGTSIPSGYTQESKTVKWNGTSESTDPTENALHQRTGSYTVPAVTHWVYKYETYSSSASSDRSGPDSSAGSWYDVQYRDVKQPSTQVTLSGGTTVTGYKLGLGKYYYNEQHIEIVDRAAYEVYTFQDGYYYYTYYRYVQNGESGWGNKQTESAICKLLGTRTVYKYRTRTYAKKYIYSKWSDEWMRSESQVSENANTKVMVKTEYRYKEK